jgi:ribA/ribD-fused uncharacterized protein
MPKMSGSDRRQRGQPKVGGPEAATEDDQAGPQNAESHNDPLFFYMPNKEYGEFCQWFPSTFVVSKRQIAELIDRPLHDENDPDPNPNDLIPFKCAEQFMMHCKAARFKDRPQQALILATDSPKQQKALGKLTVGFGEDDWSKVKFQVVEAGNMAKFSQNRHMRGRFLSTGNRMLCEASSRDRVWGIGYTAKHAMQFRQHWGDNLLGKGLMSTREKLRETHGTEHRRDGLGLESSEGAMRHVTASYIRKTLMHEELETR